METKNNYNLIFSSFTAHKPPVMSINKSKQWVIFGDTDEYKNNYPQYLIDNYNKASIHNAIINGKINYIEGQGLVIESYNSVSALAMAKGFIIQPNSYESSATLNKKFTTDLSLFGGIYAELIPTKGKENVEVGHLPFQNLRVDKEDDKHFFYTEDWSVRRPETNEDFQEFWEYEGKFEAGKNYLISKRLYRAGEGAYPLPDYIAANPIIESEWRIDNFHLNSIKGGFSAGYLISFHNGVPTLEDQKAIERQLKDKLTGDENAGAFVLSFSDGTEKSATITPIPSNDHDERFNTLSNWIVDKLVVAHNIPNPLLLGIAVEGKLGGSIELPISDFLFRANYVDNRQRFLNDFWNDLLAINGIDAVVEIKPNEVYGEGEDVNPIATALGALSPLVANKILEKMTDIEVRGLVGLSGGRIEVTENVTTSTFSKDEENDIIENHFSSCGLNDDDYEVISSTPCDFSSVKDAEESELKFATLTNAETSILSILQSNPAATVEEIADSLKIGATEVQELIDKMVIDGLLTDNNEVTDEGNNEIDKEGVLVVYKYKLRPDAPDLVKGGESRTFCKIMMGLSRLKSWTLEDINRLNNGQGLDVFSSRGGYYHKPKSNVTVPYCRHIFEQRIVKLKKK